MGVQDLVTKFADFIVRSAHPCFLCPPSIHIFPMKQIIINHFHISGSYFAGDYFDIHHNPSAVFQHGQPTPSITPDTAEEIEPIDTSFFCVERFTTDIIEKNIRQAIELATSKADACRRIMALEPLGYLVLSNVTDERKAELINPFAMPKFTLSGQDFRQARNR
jgi:hypothetical protein